jgi:hypothetical protein
MNTKKQQLTEMELNESMYMTFGRLRTAININNDLERAKLLIEKLNKDFEKAKIDENYFTGDLELKF